MIASQGFPRWPWDEGNALALQASLSAYATVHSSRKTLHDFWHQHSEEEFAACMADLFADSISADNIRLTARLSVMLLSFAYLAGTVESATTVTTWSTTELPTRVACTPEDTRERSLQVVLASEDAAVASEVELLVSLSTSYTVSSFWRSMHHGRATCALRRPHLHGGPVRADS